MKAIIRQIKLSIVNCRLSIALSVISVLFAFDSIGQVITLDSILTVVKEKNPASIIEFGPEGEEAEGYVPNLLVMGEEVFPLHPANTTYSKISANSDSSMIE